MLIQQKKYFVATTKKKDKNKNKNKKCDTQKRDSC